MSALLQFFEMSDVRLPSLLMAFVERSHDHRSEITLQRAQRKTLKFSLVFEIDVFKR